MRIWKSKYKNFICLFGSIVFFLFGFFVYIEGEPTSNPNNELTIGVFSDSFWNIQNGYSYKIVDHAIEKFEKNNPNIIVTYETGILKEDYSEWLYQKLIEEDAPDLFFILPDDFNRLVEIGALENLTPLIDLQENNFKDVFYSSTFSYGQYNNNQYALPYECAPKLMFVNQTLLDQEKIPLPDKDWTWNDFYSICQQVTKDTDDDGTLDQFGYVGYDYIDAFNSNNVDLFSDNGKVCNLTGSGVKDSIEFIERLQKLNPATTNKDFDLGNVAFKPMSFSEFRAYKPYPLSIKKYENFEWSCIPMPKGSLGNNISGLECLQLGINRKSSHILKAWELLNILTNDPEIQSQIFEYSEGVSVLKSVTEKDETLATLIESSNTTLNSEILSDAVENAVVAPRFNNYNLAMLQVDQAVNSVLDGNENLESSLIKWNRTINQSLKNNYVNVNEKT